MQGPHFSVQSAPYQPSGHGISHFTPIHPEAQAFSHNITPGPQPLDGSRQLQTCQQGVSTVPGIHGD